MPLAKELQDKSRTQKNKGETKESRATGLTRSLAPFLRQHNLWLSLRYRRSQANSLHREDGSQEQAVGQGGGGGEDVEERKEGGKDRENEMKR